MGRTIRQPVTTEVIRIYGPEPIGDHQATVLQNDAVLGISGRQKPSLFARGITGDPTRTNNGDLGAVQGDYTSVRTVAAPDSFRPGFSTALPSTSGGGTIQDSLGQLGI